jgi:exonuclease SbcC
MIPVKLQLRNFMCYRGNENAVDFSGIHLACLTGDNGQGKSALLDAMTYALWGKSRASSADDLITRGESDMEVQLEFDLKGARYRAVRKRSVAGRGSSTLDLLGQRTDGFFASLSEPTINETQKRINKLLKFDYDTFVNSSFLLQGRADEFTTKRPGERKEILADILGLSAYDDYGKRAKDKGDEARETARHLMQELEGIRAIVAQIPMLEEEVITAEQEEQRLDQQFRTDNDALQTLLDQRKALDTKEEQRHQAEQRVKEIHAQLSEVRRRLDDQRLRLAKAESLLARADEIQAAMAELEQSRQEKEQWDEIFRRSVELDQNSHALQREIDLAKGELEKQIHGVQMELKGHADTLKRYQHREQELADAQKRIELLETVRTQRDHQQRELSEIQVKLVQLKNENDRLRPEMAELKERITLLQHTEGANCPVCRQPLSAEAQATALEDANAEGKRMGDGYRANTAELKRLTNEFQELQETVATADRQLNELGKWQRIAGEGATIADALVRARAGQASATKTIATLRAQVESGDYAHTAQEELAALANTRAELGYDGKRHQYVKGRIQELSPRQQEFKELATAQEQVGGLRELISTTQQNEGMWLGQLQTTQGDIDKLTLELRERETLQKQISAHQLTVREVQSQLVNARRRHGAARQKLADAERQASRQPDIERQHGAAVEEQNLYTQLVNAFGRKGIQAMMIESAIPEIEESANELLMRMTNGRMSVSIQTQKETKAGNPTETLDIFISDEQGNRPYETFSGGEAFRVNFALRIALSRLLANRAGTSLRTLVMDEGFGSQDTQGRERLIEAINSVQADFDLIIVITHIEELKDAFPVRLEVVKGTQGSRVYVAG